MRLRFSLIFLALFTALACQAQTREGPITIPIPNSTEVYKSPPRTPPARRIDLTQVKNQADELARLASGVPSDINQMGKGLLPKDLKDKLKKIEKLSKQLRQELVE